MIDLKSECLTSFVDIRTYRKSIASRSSCFGVLAKKVCASAITNPLAAVGR